MKMMFEDGDFVLYGAALSVSVILFTLKRPKMKNKRKVWCRQWLQRRSEKKGLSALLNYELKYENPKSYRNFLRLDDEHFEQLFQLTTNLISKQNTVMRESIPSRSKLEITLRFLATGETFRSLMYGFRVHESTISRFIPLVCKAIITVLREDDYLKLPNSSEGWKSIADDYNNLWQFPHCLGALDGRHITFRAPISEGSYYYNYKGTNRVNGRISDGGVFNHSSLGFAIKENVDSLNFPSPEDLPGQDVLTPYVIIADDAFPSLKNLVKPYSGQNLVQEKRIYNYRLSRARRMGESAFGILANRFRVLLQPINLSPAKVETITLTCVLLHNYLATENAKTYTELDSIDYNNALEKISRQTGNRSSIEAREVGKNFETYFNFPIGAVPWQEDSVSRGRLNILVQPMLP